MNFEYFFLFKQQIDERQLDIGFDLYSAGHLIWLAVTIVAGILISNWYKSRSLDSQDKIRKVFAVTLAVMEVVKNIVIVIIGAPLIEYLPFHLCSFAIFGLLFDAYANKRHITTQMIAFAFFPGATAALLFCNWTHYPFFNFMNIHSFVFHAWIVFYFLMIYRNGEIKIEYKGIWNTIKVIGAVAPFVFVFNLFTGQNYLFLNEASPGSPLVPVWDIFGTRFGLPGYVFGCVLLVLVVFHILYVVYKLLDKIKNK